VLANQCKSARLAQLVYADQVDAHIKESMMGAPIHSEIDHRIIKLIVGLIAITLANATSFFSESEILSISQSYRDGHWPRDILVGSLFAISALMFAYNGFSRWEFWITKAAALSAIGVAMFPCACGKYDEVIPHAHGISAAIMFLILAELCRVFYSRAISKRLPHAKRRARLYGVCGITIILSMLMLVADHFLNGAISDKEPRIVFYCERAGLIAFGLAWLAASHMLPFFTDDEEKWIRR
jgi:hypothetical protein